MKDKEIWQKYLSSQPKEERELLENYPEYRKSIIETLDYKGFVLREHLHDLIYNNLFKFLWR